MAIEDDFKDFPRNKVIELPRPPLLPTVGGLIAMFGVLLRSFARELAWPAVRQYGGERINTVWAYREALYSELGLVALVFGLALVFLAVVRATDPGRVGPFPDVKHPATPGP